MSDPEESATLDLTGKPPKDAPSSSKPPARKSTAAKSHKAGAGLEARLEETIARAGNALANRGPSMARPEEPFNVELGEAIAEDSKAMAGGLVNLTRHVKALRPPLLIFLELFEPLLAFGRVIGIVLRRARQAREEALQAAAEYEQQTEYEQQGLAGNGGEPEPALG